MEQKLDYSWIIKADLEYNNVLIQDDKLKEAYLRGINDYHNAIYEEFVELENKLKEVQENLEEKESDIIELEQEKEDLENDIIDLKEELDKWEKGEYNTEL